MPTIVFIDSEEQTRQAEFEPGASVMEVAVRHDISGILAECGGACSCSTCHVYLEPKDIPTFEPADSTEDSLLDFTAAPRQPTSRLSCQLRLKDEHDGAVFKVARE